MRTIQISECTLTGKTWETRVRENEPSMAMAKAIKKIFGSGSVFFENRELSDSPYRKYGQVGHALPQPGAYTMDTDRLSVTIS